MSLFFCWRVLLVECVAVAVFLIGGSAGYRLPARFSDR